MASPHAIQRRCVICRGPSYAVGVIRCVVVARVGLEAVAVAGFCPEHVDEVKEVLEGLPGADLTSSMIVEHRHWGALVAGLAEAGEELMLLEQTPA